MTNIDRLSDGSQFVVRALKDTQDDEILIMLLDTIRREADTWTALDAWTRIVDVLMNRFYNLQDNGIHHVLMSRLLKYLGSLGKLDEDDIAEVDAANEKYLTVGRSCQQHTRRYSLSDRPKRSTKRSRPI
jgi:hypothetical protein